MRELVIPKLALAQLLVLALVVLSQYPKSTGPDMSHWLDNCSVQKNSFLNDLYDTSDIATTLSNVATQTMLKVPVTLPLRAQSIPHHKQLLVQKSTMPMCHNFRKYLLHSIFKGNAVVGCGSVY